MTRSSPQDWLKARALYEADKSLRQIADETGLDASNINKRAKKEGWQRGVLPQLITDAVRVKAAITTLLPHQKDVVESEIDFRLKTAEFFNNATLKNCSMMMSKVNDSAEIVDHRIAQETLNKGRENMLGKTPDSATNVQVNAVMDRPPLVGFRVEPVA